MAADLPSTRKLPGTKREFPPAVDAIAERGTDRQEEIPAPNPHKDTNQKLAAEEDGSSCMRGLRKG